MINYCLYTADAITSVKDHERMFLVDLDCKIRVKYEFLSAHMILDSSMLRIRIKNETGGNLYYHRRH